MPSARMFLAALGALGAVGCGSNVQKSSSGAGGATTSAATTSVSSGTTSASSGTISSASTTSTSGTGGMAAGCDAGVSCTAPVDCPAPSACQAATCAGGCCGIEDTAAGTTCAVNGGTVCDGAGACVACLDSTDCPSSGTTCAVPTCDSTSHTCSTVGAPSGTACTDNGGSTCDGTGRCVGCEQDDQCAPSGTVCAVPMCDLGSQTCSNDAAPTGLACAENGGVVCDGSGHCVACNQTSDCPATGTACATPSCDTAAHTCSAQDAAAGTACNDHGGVVCDGTGHCVACDHDSDCAATSTACSIATCNSATHACSDQSATAGVACADNGGVVCDGAGHCVACNQGSDCPASGTLCAVPTCDAAAHTCSDANAAAGTACTDDGGVVCDGSGACVACNKNSDCPASGTVCAVPACDATAHTCSDANAAAGTACSDNGGTACNGAGACVKSLPVALEAVAGSCYTTSTDVDPFTASLLTTAGFDVSMVDGNALSTAAGIDKYSVVVFGAGAFSCAWDWALFDGQLQAYVEAGGGVVVTGWATYFMAMNTDNQTYPGLASILPATAGLQYNSGAADTIVPGHPITAGLTAGFTNPTYTAYGAGTPAGATPLLTEGGITVAAAWSIGKGRVVYLGPIFMADFSNYGNEPLLDGTLPSAKQVFINSVAWAAHQL